MALDDRSAAMMAPVDRGDQARRDEDEPRRATALHIPSRTDESINFQLQFTLIIVVSERQFALSGMLRAARRRLSTDSETSGHFEW